MHGLLHQGCFSFRTSTQKNGVTMLIRIDGATKSFDGLKVLDGVSFHVPKGQRLIILGQNGAGKTTLLRSMLGQYRLDSGSIRINDLDPTRQRKEVLSGIAFIPQLPPPLPFALKVLFDYAEQTSGTRGKEVVEFCRRFGLDVKEHIDKPFDRLSGGMKQKVLASLAFARHAPIMFFDEPTANLDPESRRTFGEMICSEAFRETTMIFISHHVEELGNVLNRAIWLDFGRIVKDDVIR